MKDPLFAKIGALFSYRKLPELIALSSARISQDDRDAFSSLLFSLQRKIYELDKVLETQFEIDPAELDSKWGGIYKVLEDLKIGSDKLDEYCSEIYRYQKHELSLREGNAILKLPLEFFYYYKSCDVKLIRRIIYDKFEDLESVIPIKQWTLFDLITEINDDVEDIYEDLLIINGNRYLLEIKENGLDKTHHTFTSFLDGMALKYRSVFTDQSDLLVVNCTQNELKNTINLLKQRFQEISKHGLQKSVAE